MLCRGIHNLMSSLYDLIVVACWNDSPASPVEQTVQRLGLVLSHMQALSISVYKPGAFHIEVVSPLSTSPS